MVHISTHATVFFKLYHIFTCGSKNLTIMTYGTINCVPYVKLGRYVYHMYTYGKTRPTYDQSLSPVYCAYSLNIIIVVITILHKYALPSRGLMMAIER